MTPPPLAPQLPAFTDPHRQTRRGYQSLMGGALDVAVLLAAGRLEQFWPLSPLSGTMSRNNKAATA